MPRCAKVCKSTWKVQGMYRESNVKVPENTEKEPRQYQESNEKVLRKCLKIIAKV